MPKRILILGFIFMMCLLTQKTIFGQNIVVSSYFNGGDPREEWTEILVIQDFFDLRNYTIRDNNSSQTGWQTAATFNNIPFWNNLRAGTIIVIWHRHVDIFGDLHPLDVNKNDGYLEVHANDAAYFTGGVFGTPPGYNGNSLNVAGGGDIIQLRDAGGNHIHALGHITAPGTNWTALPAPKLNHTQSLGSGEAVSVCPGSNLADYGTPPQSGTTYTSKSNSLLTQGLPNQCAISSTANSDFWRSLRQPGWTSPLLTATFTPPATVNLSWNACTDPYPADNTQGYIILRNTTNSFTAPTDGRTFSVGEVFGGATVIAMVPSSQTVTYTDNYAIPCGTSVYYRVYAYRYGTDNINGNNFNVARGRAYNEANFAAASIDIAAAPAIASVEAVDATCGLENGSITINATGGTPPLQYSIDNGVSWQPSNVFPNLAPDFYTVIIKDINECLTIYSGNDVEISDIAGPDISQVNYTNATCGNNNGTITITATGGTPPLEYSINGGGTWQSSNVFLGLSPGDYYIEIEDDNDCETEFSGNPVTIDNLPGPDNPIVDKVDASCGNNNGSISVTASGGTPPYQYSKDNGVTWQPASTFINLAPDSYTVIVKDANDCLIPYALNPVVIDMIPAPVAPTTASSDRDNICADDPGNIVLTASGGSGLALEWFTGSCGGTLIGTGNNLTIPSPVVTTTYFVYWTSTSCGNSSCASVTVTVGDPPTLSAAGPDQSLCGVLTTTLAANQPTTGTGLWSLISGPGSATFSDPALYNSVVTVTQYGAYTFRWTISNGTICAPSTDDVVITFSDVIIVTVGSNSPVCVGNTIFLTSSISGATYSWTGPDGFTSALQNPEIPGATMLNEGTYNVTVGNIPGGCPSTSGSTAVDIIETPAAPASASADPDEICAGTSGTIQLTATGGSGTQLVWSSEACNGTVIGTGIVLDIPAPSVTTTYYASWTSDQCGNSSCASVTVTVSDAPTTAEAGANQSLCGVLVTSMAANEPAIGTGEWTVVSGPGAVTFSDPALFNSQVTVSLEGIYVLQWTISNGTVCAPSADEVSLNFGDAIDVVASSNSPVCTGTDINLTSSIAGATYSWTGPNGFTSVLQNPAVPNATPLDEGTFTVQVTNIPGGCPPTSNWTDVAINPSPAEVASVSADIPSFCAGSAGSITLTANGGSGDAVEWLTGGCNGTVIGTGTTLIIPAPAVTTSYDARWTSALCGNSGCKSVTVTVEQPPTVSVAGPDQSICNDLYTTLGANTPLIGSGQWSTISGPGTILYIDPTAPNCLINASNMGTYLLQWTITSGSVCPASTDNVTVEFGNQILVSANSNSPVCEGEDITLFSSIAGATYSWTGPGGFTSALQNPVLTGASVSNSGDYTITVSGIPGGCPNSAATINVVVGSIPSLPMVNSQNMNGSAQDVCEGSTVAYAIADPVNGSIYTWDISGGGNINPGGSSDIIEIDWFATNGTYDVTVKETNASGCESALYSVAVTILPASYPAISIVADKNPTCEGTMVQFTAAVSDGGTNPDYNWNRNGVPVGSNNSIYVLDTPADNDLITCEITSDNLCASPATISSNTIELTVYDSLKISCTDEEAICSGTPTLLTPGSGFVSYLWSDGSAGPSLTVEETGVYWVMVTDTAGCTASDTIIVEPCANNRITIPSAFTPNSDGSNDRFIIVCSNPEILSGFEINIYNRWGQLIHTGKDIGDGWDGTVNGNPAPVDVYTYIISYTITEPKIEFKQIPGNVALIR